MSLLHPSAEINNLANNEPTEPPAVSAEKNVTDKPSPIKKKAGSGAMRAVTLLALLGWKDAAPHQEPLWDTFPKRIL